MELLEAPQQDGVSALGGGLSESENSVLGAGNGGDVRWSVEVAGVVVLPGERR